MDLSFSKFLEEIGMNFSYKATDVFNDPLAKQRASENLRRQMEVINNRKKS